MLKTVLVVGLFISFLASIAAGDSLVLKDGTSLEGRVIEQSDGYWFKDANGQSRVVPKGDVTRWTTGSETPINKGTTGVGATDAKPPAYAPDFATNKAKADGCQSPIQAVALWQSFIDAKPSDAELTKAKVELAHWKELSDGNAEKINGKWLWGEERKKLIERSEALLLEYDQLNASSQTLAAIAKLQEAVKVYPNSFFANFELGFFNMVKGAESRNLATIDAGIHALEAASKLDPASAAALSNLAVGYFFREKYEQAILTAYKAAKLQDSKEIVQNLVNTIALAPPNLRRSNPKIKPIMEEAALLATKYGIPGAAGHWVWVHPTRHPGIGHEGDDIAKGPPGIFANGSGFFISADGYIVTNRHVAKPADYLIVRLSDGTEKLAERVVIDDVQDVAVLRIKVDGPVPFVRLAAYDHPPAGADVAVFGFPMLGQFGLNSTVKMTRGIVTAWDKDQENCDVTVDAQVNPGNSGGPMVDRRGNLLALTAMKTLANASISSYGLGMSTGRLRRFFEQQHVKLPDVHMESGKETDPELSNEELAKRLTPATVCILCCRGTPPDNGSKVKPAIPVPARKGPEDAQQP